MIKQARPEQQQAGYKIDPEILKKVTHNTVNLHMWQIQEVIVAMYKLGLIQLYPHDAMNQFSDEPLVNESGEPTPEGYKQWMNNHEQRVSALETRLHDCEQFISECKAMSLGKVTSEVNTPPILTSEETSRAGEGRISELGSRLNESRRMVLEEERRNEKLQVALKKTGICGVHIGVLQHGCPVCAVEDLQPRLDKAHTNLRHWKEEAGELDGQVKVWKEKYDKRVAELIDTLHHVTNERDRLLVNEKKANQLYTALREGKPIEKDGSGMIDEVAHLVSSRDSARGQVDDLKQTVGELEEKLASAFTESRVLALVNKVASGSVDEIQQALLDEGIKVTYTNGAFISLAQ